MDDKTKTLKAIKKNHEDGLTQSEIQDMFDINRYDIEVILRELQIEQRIRSIKKGRFYIYKVIENERL